MHVHRLDLLVDVGDLRLARLHLGLHRGQLLLVGLQLLVQLLFLRLRKCKEKGE